MKRIAFWGVFIGIIIIIFGVIFAFQGFFSTIIGVVPGILAIIIGRLIYNSGIQAKMLLESKGEKVSTVNVILKEVSLSLISVGLLIGIFIISYVSFILIARFY